MITLLPLPSIEEISAVSPLAEAVRNDLRGAFQKDPRTGLKDINEAFTRHSVIVGGAVKDRLRENISMDEFLAKITEQFAVFAGMRLYLLDIMGLIPDTEEAEEAGSMLLGAEQEIATFTAVAFKEVQVMAAVEDNELVWGSNGFTMVEPFPFNF